MLIVLRYPAQLMGVATLEFGVCLHSVIIGLTLAVTGDDEFNVLFVVIIFHQVRRRCIEWKAIPRRLWVLTARTLAPADVRRPRSRYP